jgi:hypothetical protein
LHHGNGCTIRDSNFEGFKTGLRLTTGSWGNQSRGNGGEKVNLFHDIEDSHQNTFDDPGISYPQANKPEPGRLIRYAGSSTDNELRTRRLKPGGGQTYYEDPLAYEDLSTGTNHRVS